MDRLEKLLDMGKTLGYDGQELRNFVAERERLARDDRLEEREAKRLADENETKRREIELRQVEMKLKHDLEMSQIQLQAEQIKADSIRGSTENISSQGSSVSFRVPKLPCFVDGKDGIDSYLSRFETYAESMQWPKEKYALCLSALLTGKALEVLSRIPQDLVYDYDHLKTALLEKYQLTSDDFRNNFFSMKQAPNESAPQFMGKLKHYFTRWIALSNTEESFEGVRELILREQFLSSCPRNVSVFLREQVSDSIESMMELATRFTLAHSSESLSETMRDKAVYHPSVLPKHSSQGRQANSRPARKCFLCDRPGHLAAQCRQGRPPNEASRLDKSRNMISGNAALIPGETKHRSSKVKSNIRSKCDRALPSKEKPEGPHIYKGYVNKISVDILRDTGCSGVIAKMSLINPNQLTGKKSTLMMVDSSMLEVPTAVCFIDSPVFTGEVEVCCLDNPAYDLIIGNIIEARAMKAQLPLSDQVMQADGEVGHDPTATTPTEVSNERYHVHQGKDDYTHVDTCETKEIDMVEYVKLACAVETRAKIKAKAKIMKPLIVPKVINESSSSNFAKAQSEDPTLRKSFENAKRVKPDTRNKSTIHWFEKCDETLYRFYKPSDKEDTMKQLMVPTKYRPQILKLGHDCAMAGHLGVRKTLDRILVNFFWPGMFGDVRRYCRSCDICQRTVDKGTVTRAPVQNMPLECAPFEKVSIDLIGPIAPMSDRGHRYILTLVDFSTRYPEAVALRNIDTESVAEALLGIFARLGVPRVLLSDNGPQFISDLMQEITRLLSIRLVHSSIYHPMSNGLVEKFNGTLKRMLRRMSAERPKDWDRYIEPLLFAYREVPQASAGFSPFELLYGRSVRGPMEILREMLSGDEPSEETRSAYEYVIDLRNRIDATCRLASENLENASKVYKRHFDKKAKMRYLEVGNKVLILLPTDHNKLIMKWKGPFEVIEKVGSTDYRVQIGNNVKLFHINMLKLYVDRNDNCEVEMGAFVAIVEDDDDELPLASLNRKAKETHIDVHVSETLTWKQSTQLRAVLSEFSDVFSDMPGCTNLISHEIKLENQKPTRVKPYIVPYAKRQAMNDEIEKMISLDIIESSNSPYSSPMLLVKKHDGSFRPVIDYRKLNKLTVFDAEPIPNADEICSQLSSAKFFSKLDFCCGYWQISMSVADKEKTAFATPKGLYAVRPCKRGGYIHQNDAVVVGRHLRR